MAYASKLADDTGFYDYTADEHAVWAELFERQIAFLKGRICSEYLEGVDLLGLKAASVPQLRDVDKRLGALTNFGVEGVPAIIPPSQFYTLLADRKFPVATFLRRREDMDYIEEPDLFHEVFGHCPLLTNQAYTDFIEAFGKIAVELGKGYRWHLFRLFWFTIEFGMINTPDGLRGYGAGVASSPSEADFACSGKAVYTPADLMTMLRTPYRIDIVQPQYFVIDSFEDLPKLLETDLKAAIDEAKALGDLPALFEKAA
ncbi:phenylalanine 4-monooxygenase [Neptunicoccus sediminis]|uniref:phenylalanine 4-monooxygenase n=1 Tax=Neptunicoccus sediminis TaxID=1892596 RepID=UPI000845FA49|nr:phenylalanine 4-monooxygenase [Neptunicoccus sediminis]